MLRFALLILLTQFVPGAAQAQATSFDSSPIAWGERDERHTTICAKRWHAIKIRNVRTNAVNQGMGAEQQIELESQLIFSGDADCFTGQIVYQPVKHADVILDALTWVQMPDSDGPVTCFKNQRCRWMIQTQHFVEAKVEIDGKAVPETVYVATPRPVQPARAGETILPPK